MRGSNPYSFEYCALVSVDATDIDYMTTLQSCFRVVLVNYLIDSEECEWSFFFGAIMPEAPPAVGSAIVAQSVGKNNKTCSE